MNYISVNLVVYIIFISRVNICNSQNSGDESRIIGGFNCKSNRSINIKFLIAIIDCHGRHLCGGSLLSSRWVLTSAHCIFDENIYDIYAVDRYTRDDCVNNDGLIEAGCKLYSIKAVYLHPSYETGELENDIALLYLYSPIQTTRWINYVKLPAVPIKGDVANECSDGMYMGWGGIDNKKRIPKNLQCLDQKIQPYKTCQGFADFFIPEELICSSPSDKFAFHGDSGSPLMCNDVQYGVIIGAPSYDQKKRAVFSTRVDFHLDFIQTVQRSNGLQIFRINFIFILCYLVVIIYNMYIN